MNFTKFVGEFQYEYEKDLLFGEKYLFYAETKGCKRTCSAESNLKEIQLCMSIKF